MKRGLLTVAAVAEGGTGSRAARFACFQPLLGKTCLELALVALAGLKPARIYLATRLRREDIPGAKTLSGLEFLAADGQPWSLNFLFSLKGVLQKRGGKDLLILDVRFPLLQPKTLKALLRRHLARRNALTILSNGLNADRRRKGLLPGEAGFPEVVAVLVRAEALLEVWAGIAKAKPQAFRLASLVREIERKGKKMEMVKLPQPEAMPVDGPARLAAAIMALRLRKIRQLEQKGVTVLDPLTTWVDLDVRVGRDTVLYPSVVIEGDSRLGRECRLYPFVHLVNTRVGDRVRIFSSTMIERSRVEDEAQVGPFAHFRPNTVLRPKAKVGNFVEMKNTVFGPGSKAGHLSYLGDCVVEGGVNIGAGTITCNYDGLKKYRTIIESGAFIGSGTELVAPVRVGRNAYIGAGSTITKDVSPEALAVARSRQTEKPGWARRRMKRKCAG